MKNWPFMLALLALVAPLTGCHNSCFVFISNPGGGPLLVNPAAACTSVTPHGAVHAAVRVRPACKNCSELDRINHLLVTLQGMEIHPAADSGADSSGWIELFPEYAVEHRQLDFMNTSTNGIDAAPLGKRTELPAGNYDRVRLSFAGWRDGADNQNPADSPCGKVGPNCLVFGDGRVLALELETGKLEFHFDTSGLANGFITILPNTENQLVLELTPAWATSLHPKRGVRLLPGLAGTARGSISVEL